LYLFLLSLRSHLYFTHFPSFPTRRSSDLFGFFGAQDSFSPDDYSGSFCVYPGHPALPSVIFLVRGRPLFLRLFRPPNGGRRCGRSEEHTSELQSRFDLVCRLLLEKKKKKD